MTYPHLTYSDRIKINALLQLEFNPSEIAAELGRPKCTIYRELKRNSYEGFYFVETAQLLAKTRKSLSSINHTDDDEELWERIEAALRHGLSPAQVSGRLRAEGSDFMSTSTIYKRVKQDRLDGGDLWMFLRRSRKTYRRNFAMTCDPHNKIKNRVSIEERPEKVDYRERIGDLEGDTIIGARHKGVLLTLNDRVTKKVAIEKLESKNSEHVCEVMIGATVKFPGKKHTCTLDNGKEFAGHEDFTEATGIKVYFCKPRAPEERGSNENTNGLIRQFLPKGTDLSKVTRTQLRKIEYKLNSRPRKSLNFLTPLEAESKAKLQFYFFS
jgi:IS30 family transposase